MNYRKIYEQHNGPIPKGFHVHHKDMNHANNHPTNLEALSPDEHAKKHGFLNNFIMSQSTASERARKANKKPENRSRMSESMRKSDAHRKSILKRSQNPVWRENVSLACKITAKNRATSPWNKGKVGCYKLSETTKNILSAQRYGRLWFTDGIVEKFIHLQDVPVGFRRGRK